MLPRKVVVATSLIGLLPAVPASAQTAGQIVGVVVDSRDSTPIPEVQLSYRYGSEPTMSGPVTGTDGTFVIIGLPPGRYVLAARRIGYLTIEVQDILVRSGSSARVTVMMRPAPLALQPIEVVSAEPSLLAPDITASRQLITREEIRTSPIESVEQIMDLQIGVTDGRFRGGRFGQESYIIDGVDVKDQFSASTTGAAFQLAPSAVQEVSLLTSGFTADQGSGVSGIVSLVTRQGPRDRWIGRIEFVSDDWAPDRLKRGYTRAGASLGGPLKLLPDGSRIFMDLTVFARADQDPRVRGLTCLDSFDCPDFARSAIIPHQRGDRYFSFGRLDVPLARTVEATLTFNKNRDQHELYSTRFKYNLPNYLAERQTGTLASLALSGTIQPSSARAIRLTSRVSLGRVDRYLGVPDTVGRSTIGRFRIGNMRFRGQDFVRLPVADQISRATVVPGYVQPSDSGTGSPYGILGADLFVTDGTSAIAQWSQTDFLDLKVEAQTLVSTRHDLKIGGNIKLYHVQTYQHVAAGLVGAAPSFAEFYPASAAAYIHNTLFARDAATVDLGARVEAFQPRLSAPTDRRNLSAPSEDTEWRVQLAPRIGFGIPLSVFGFDRAAFRWNFGLFSQPPDFQFFFDQALDDSLNTAVRRQGNPNLGFERGVQYEFGIEYLFSPDVVLKTTGFLKDLTSLTTTGIAVSNQPLLFTNLDFGRVEGVETRVQARFGDGNRIDFGYGWQRAFGVVSDAFDSTKARDRLELPLQFDRRHAFDLNLLWTLPGGVSAALAGSAGSGFPVPGAADQRLPWTVALAARLLKELALAGGRVGFMIEGRNLLKRDNLVTARPGPGLDPNIAELEARAVDETRGAVSIPRESPLYVERFDANANGFLEPVEQTAARRAALLDFFEPTLLFGEARQLRLGLEWRF